MNIVKSMQRSPFAAVALAAAATLLGASQALAADPEGTAQSVTVSYRDLDLATMAGATALYRRIQDAAHQVCGNEPRELARQHQDRQCYRDAVGKAVDTVNNPLLTELHSGRAPLVTASTLPT